MSEDENQNKVSAVDLIQLKHALNQSITYKGLNARDIMELKEISYDGWQQVKGKYSIWEKETWLLRDNFFLCVGLFGIVLMSQRWIDILAHGWIRIMAGSISIYSFFHLGSRTGRREGFLTGYYDGHDAGINKALGLTDSDAKEIRDRAIEMEMDEGLLTRIDKETDP